MNRCTQDCNQGRSCTCGEYDPILPAIDMDRVAREAMGLRAWRLEFDCNGQPFVWTGSAGNESAAESLARYELQTDQVQFRSADARLVACLER